MEKLPLETQTLYAQLMETLLALEAHRSMGILPVALRRKPSRGYPTLIFSTPIQAAFTDKYTWAEKETRSKGLLSGSHLKERPSGRMLSISRGSVLNCEPVAPLSQIRLLPVC